MSTFTTPLQLEYIDGHNYRLLSKFEYYTNIDAFIALYIPEGFVTDFASIPRLLWNILPPTGEYGKIAVVHDYLYRTRGLATKAEADAVFLEGMEVLGVGLMRRYVMYWAVRLFGGLAYKGGR